MAYDIIWKDRKRFLGLPLSFTRYSMSEDRLFLSVGSTDSQKEREANEFAQNMLISPKTWNTMMKSRSIQGIRFGNIIERLKTLSKEHNLDFSLVVWRWKYESHIYQIKGIKATPIQ